MNYFLKSSAITYDVIALFEPKCAYILMRIKCIHTQTSGRQTTLMKSMTIMPACTRASMHNITSHHENTSADTQAKNTREYAQIPSSWSSSRSQCPTARSHRLGAQPHACAKARHSHSEACPRWSWQMYVYRRSLLRSVVVLRHDGGCPCATSARR